MWGFGVLALTLIAFVIAGLWGAAAVLLARRSTLSASVAFGWGTSLGPVGVIAVVVLVARRRISTPTGEPDFGSRAP